MFTAGRALVPTQKRKTAKDVKHLFIVTSQDITWSGLTTPKFI